MAGVSPGTLALSCSGRDIDSTTDHFTLTTRAVWESTQGLNPGFSGLGYAIVDFCMRLRQDGLRVTYDPRVIYDAFDVEDVADREMVAQSDRKLLRSRHGQTLTSSHLPRSDANILRARIAGAARPALLLVADSSQWAERFTLWAKVAEQNGWFVTVLLLNAQSSSIAARLHDQDVFAEILIGGGRHELESRLQQASGYYAVCVVYGAECMRLVSSMVAADASLFDGTRLVYDAKYVAAAHAVWRDAFMERLPNFGTSAGAIIEEVSLAASADLVVLGSAHESVLFQSRIAAPVITVADPVTIPAEWPGFESRDGVLLLGGGSGERCKRDAIWFREAVWPLLGEQLGQASLQQFDPTLSSHDDGVLAAAAARARIAIVTDRPDAANWADVSAAMAAGTPIVATSSVASRLGLAAHRHVMVADEPAGASWPALRSSTLKRRCGVRSRKLRATRLRTKLRPITYRRKSCAPFVPTALGRSAASGTTRRGRSCPWSSST